MEFARTAPRWRLSLPDAALLRIVLTYLWRHRRMPRLGSPASFNELVQLRKLHDRDPRLTLMTDKVLAKTFVAERIGAEWVTPTLWHGEELPEVAPWPRPFVVKSRHGSNQIAFVRSGEEDWQAIRRRAARWQRSAYGFWLDEWCYRHVERGLLVEPFIGTDHALPTDYKLFVFGGRVEFIQVHVDRETRHQRVVFDRRWRPVSIQPDGLTERVELRRPASLERLIEAAETLGRDTDFVRVDLYDEQPHPRFGEMTFYPGSGLDPFRPRSLDAVFGAHWLRARAIRPTW